ncbi:MAG: electron transfer flavoprotein subunit beta/FixA family protein [Planctomycetes bacterium]|nr:electron transfer flavoprotein subunit beta/FixA family protein [Planctomycetota bacterium]
MEIIVCVKRVPDVAEVEVEVDRSGRALERQDLAYGINEWDNFAIEAAVSLVEAHGGRSTAVTVGGPEDEEVLRRALAMGVNEALHLCDPAFAGADAHGVALLLQRAIAARPFDLVLTGAISSDQRNGQVGGMLAALLGIPQVALATELKVENGRAVVRHEVEGGLERVVELDLPALVSVQTGINEPRYVSVRGIRKVADQAIPVLDAASLGLDAAQAQALLAQVRIEELFLPQRGKGAEMLEGSDEEKVLKLIERLRERGGL